ncbi:hypothetical protein H109_03621 [Trichophyton interdigitale MR816]|uniref:Cyclochlorotine biosynthesis protein O n=1 Tax=Trichophyton interdigitale (strain MR816) TaxID=1215338 RepID=A0A059J9H0_TRIIM|nr:hypothetical protein H101_00228 [Trichophyton interdigitale H6]KDB24526.1 hypothetical protein H109_03621 [Trichophyton interdigitale MR816]
MFSFKFVSAKIPYLNRGEEYTSLRNGTSSPSDECEVEDKIPLYLRTTPLNANSGRLWRFSVILLLLVINVTTFAALFFTRHLTSQIEAAEPIHTPNSWARIDTLPSKFTRFNWWTEYSDKNFTETDAAWDSMNTAHGFIAMDRKWAKERHWPDSMHLPSDDSKNVYLLEAYHLLHCVAVIRRTFWEAVNRVDKYTFNPPHSAHCIDTLRQYVICKADSTPLYLYGDDTAGDEQYRKCKDWNALRQFATDHSACYMDTPRDADPDTFPFGAHFGHCDDGTDGVMEGERRGNWKHGAVWDGPDA